MKLLRAWWALAPGMLVTACGGGGNAPGPNTLEVRPGQSIQGALDRARPGQTVLVYPGTYRPSSPAEALIVFRADRNGVTLRGAGSNPQDVVLDGYRQVLHVIFFDQGIDRSTVVENLTVTGGNAYPDTVLPASFQPLLRPEITDRGNDFYRDGAGLMLFVAAPTIRNCRIVDNLADLCGAGISVFCPGDLTFPSPGPLIFGNEILNNTIGGGTGAGIDVYFRARAEIVNNLFVGNRGWGGAVAVLDDAAATIDFNTIVGNYGSVSGVATSATATVTLSNTIIANNLEGAPVEAPGAVTIRSSCFWNNADPYTPPSGQGNLSADPLFVAGPRGSYYLSQRGAGQGADSPGLDAASVPASSSSVAGLTTRTDLAADTGTADIGYHYRP